MNVNDPNLPSSGSTGTAKSLETSPSALSNRSSGGAGRTSAAPDDVHLSELVRSLRFLAGDSPERQARIEQITRAYANGTYQVDGHATASKMIDDAFES
jgi:flagellar biosynthesis anti-sigma factor FlgM